MATLLLSSLSETPTPFCGFRVSNAPKLWEAQAYLKASNADANDLFGNSVAISGETIVVGAPGESSNQTTITNGSTAVQTTQQVLRVPPMSFKDWVLLGHRKLT